MNPEVKKVWVDDLLSKKYRQGRGKLRDLTVCGYEYCCLAVLADKCPIAKWDHGFLVDLTGELQVHYLQPSVLAWAGLSGDDARELAEMNDKGDDFPTIAKFITENL